MHLYCHYMKRKVAKIGPSTLMVSLPSRWVKQHNINKGDELDVIEQGHTLAVSLRSAQKGDYGTVTSTHRDLIKRYLNSLYRRGYDEVKIVCDQPLSINQLTREISQLLGFEIIEHTKNSFVVKIISESIDNEFDTIFNRIFLINISLGRESYETIKNKKFDQLEHVQVVEATNNKLTNLCLRILNKKGHKEPDKITTLSMIVTGLERIGDYYRDICRFLIGKKSATITKETLQFYADVNDLFEYLYRHKHKFRDIMYAFRTKRNAIMKRYLALIETKNKEESVILSYLFGILKETIEMELIFLDLTL